MPIGGGNSSVSLIKKLSTYVYDKHKFATVLEANTYFSNVANESDLTSDLKAIFDGKLWLYDGTTPYNSSGFTQIDAAINGWQTDEYKTDGIEYVIPNTLYDGKIVYRKGIKGVTKNSNGSVSCGITIPVEYTVVSCVGCLTNVNGGRYTVSNGFDVEFYVNINTGVVTSWVGSTAWFSRNFDVFVEYVK